MEMWPWIPVLSFLAVAEHRLIPASARSIGHQLRKACRQSVCAPACQGQLPGGHAGVGVISLCGASLCAPSLVTPEFKEFFRWVTLPAADGGVVHLFVVRVDPQKLSLTDRLLQAVLAEAQVVCVGSLCLLLVILMLILVLSLPCQGYFCWSVC